MNISGVEIGSGQPCRFVCEISNNHNGSMDRALRLIDAAKAAGCDFVKFQCYTADELVALRGDGPAPSPWGEQGWTMRALYERAATPLRWFPELFAFARSIGIVPFSSVFGTESLALLESLGCPALKVARLDNRTRFAEELCANAKVPTIASTSGNMEGELNADLLLWCPVGYPQVPPFDFAAKFPGYDGFSYHGKDLGVCIEAAKQGAKIIEAHFQLDDEPSELEANVSLTQHQFREMVDTVRRVEGML